MNKFIVISIAFVLMVGCSQQQHYRRSTSIPKTNTHSSTSKECEMLVPYEEEKRLLAAIPEKNKVCAESTVQAIEQATKAAGVTFSCAQRRTYEFERVLGRKSSSGAIFMKPSLDLYIEIADKALKNNCIDLADKMYRNLIGVYIPILKSYDYALAESLNDRAKIGVDDVRAVRNKISKK